MDLKELEKDIDTLSIEELEDLYCLVDEYETTPVSIEEFITNPDFLGSSFPKSDEIPGSIGFYPYWLNVLKEIYPSPVYSPYYIIFLRGCLAGDTLISTLNGNIRIDEIASRFKLGEDFWVLSYNINTKSYEPDKITNAFTTGVKELYEITLDSGEKIKCTSNHKFLTRDKKWKSIDSGLKVNDSLYPYRYEEHSGYHKFFDVETNKWVTRYKLVANSKTDVNKDSHIHHKDFNKLNDSPNNLVIIPAKKHWEYHAKHGGRVWRKFNKSRSKEYWQKLGSYRAKLYWNAVDNKESKQNRNKKISEWMKNGGAKELSLRSKNKPGFSERNGKIFSRINKNEETQFRWQQNKAIKRTLEAYRNFGVFYYKEKTVVKYFGSIEAFKDSVMNFNHRIVSIVKTSEDLVFDITTEKNHNFILSNGIISHNSIGRGKSTCANIIMAYEIYKLLCLKNPQQKFGVIPSTRIVFALMNITLSLSTSVVWDQLNQYFSESKYFNSIIDLNRKMKGKDTLFPKRIDISIGSRIQHGLGQAVFGAFLDEAGFDVLNNQVVKNFQSLITRMQSRFMQEAGAIPGKLIVASSESVKGSSLTKLAEIYKGKPGVYVNTGPLWEIRPWRYSGKTFKIFVGTDAKEPEIITDNNYDFYKSEDASIIDVPVEHKDAFESNLYDNIRDIAGIATTATYKFIRNRDKLIKSLIVAPLFEDIIKLDFDNPDDRIIDKIKVADYFSNPIQTKSPRYIHIDIGLTGDRLGIACGSIIDYTEFQSRNNITLENKFEIFPKIQIEWAFGIEPTPGKQIPLFKIREFIFELSRFGYHVGKITLDGFQSADTIQVFKINNYNAELSSVDKTMTPYIQTRDAMYQGRLLLPNNKILYREFSELEVDNKNNKIDHPEKNIDNSKGSKDISDAIAGVVTSLTAEAHKFKTVSQLISQSDVSQEQANLRKMFWGK